MKLLHEIFIRVGSPVLFVVFLMLFALEAKFELRKRVQSKWKRLLINNFVALPSFVLLRFMFLPAMIWLTIQNELLRFGLNHMYNLPVLAEAIIAFLIFDYTNYLWHILNHRLPILWRFHLVHHTDRDLDVSTAIRFHFGEMVGSLFFRGAFVFFSGATPLHVIVYEIIFEAATLFHHSNLRLPLAFEKILNKIFVTPRMHGIHHSMIKDERDSNYSVIFSFWDRLHRTIRLNIRQSLVVTGVPAYSNPKELTIGYLLKLPFLKIRSFTGHETRERADSTGSVDELQS